ncbi:MAG: hypothetical protein ABI416_13630 [Ginsengibacter sp.]
MKIKNDIERLFADVQKIIFSPRKPGKNDPKNVPLVTLIFSPEKMEEHAGKEVIVKTMETLYSRKCILLINPVARFIHFSIADADGNNPIPMPNAQYDRSFPEFLQKTRWHDKIFLLIGGFDNFVSDLGQELKQNLFLILDGYSFA